MRRPCPRHSTSIPAARQRPRSAFATVAASSTCSRSPFSESPRVGPKSNRRRSRCSRTARASSSCASNRRAYPRRLQASSPTGFLSAPSTTPDATVVEEGALLLSAFRQAAAQLTPRTSRGRFSGKHRLAFDNFGNSPATVAFTPEDGENALRIRCLPEPLIVGPATAGFARVKVTPHRRFLTGPDRVYPFRVRATVDDAEPIDVEGLHIQHAVLPRLVLPMVILLAAAAILWAIFKPEPNSTAKQLQAAQAQKQAVAATALVHKDAEEARTQAAAVAKQVHEDAEKALDQATAAAKQVRKDTKQAAEQATAAANAAKQAGTVAGRAATAAAAAKAAATPPFGGVPTGMRLALRCPPTCTATLLLPAGQTLYASDLLLANPGDDKGTLRLKLNGKPLLVEGLDSFRTLHHTPATPLLLSGGQTLALAVVCANTAGKPCTPSAYVGGFSPPKPPDPTGPNGAPVSLRLDLRCPPTCTASTTVPSGATATEPDGHPLPESGERHRHGDVCRRGQDDPRRRTRLVPRPAGCAHRSDRARERGEGDALGVVHPPGGDAVHARPPARRRPPQAAAEEEVGATATAVAAGPPESLSIPAPTASGLRTPLT